MKHLLLLAGLATAISSYTPIASADNEAQRICEYVSVNDSKRLRNFLKDRKLKIRSIFDNIQCNGQNLLIFAASSNALDTGEMIISQLPKNIVEANLEAIAAHSAHLATKAKERIL
jgi:hypothetical protein